MGDVPAAPGDVGDRRPWSIALLMSAAFGALYMLYSLFWMPLVHGAHGWIVSNDVWLTVGPSQYVTWGAFPYLYSANPGFYALPLGPILLTPVVAVADALHLSDGYPFPLPHPSMWLMVEPVLAASGVFVLHAGRSLLWSAGIRRRLWLAQLVLLLVVVLPCTVWGHFEDTLAVAGVLYCVRLWRDGRFTGAAIALGLAICCKQWAVIGIPFILLHSPRESRKRVALYSMGPALALAALPLMLDWHDAFRALVAEQTPPPHAYWHVGLFGHLGSTSSRLSRALTVAASPVLAYFSRRRPWPQVVGLLGLGLLLRALLEPLLFPYYLAPGLAVLAMAICIKGRRIPVVGPVLTAMAAIWALPQAKGDLRWWAGELVLLALVGWLLFRRRQAADTTTAGGPGVVRSGVTAVAGASGTAAPRSMSRELAIVTKNQG